MRITLARRSACLSLRSESDLEDFAFEGRGLPVCFFLGAGIMFYLKTLLD
jgi:hypothetical protein